MDNKITGYILLVIGIAVIIFATFSVYSVFNGRSTPYNLFQFDGVSIPVSSLLGPEMASVSNAPDIELLKADVLNSTTNTIFHLLLMGFISSIGYKIAIIGANLVRPIVVKSGALPQPKK